MKYLLTGKQASEVDKYTIEQTVIPSMILMERAALACAAAVDPEPEEHIICICGCGNNGGDGVAVARILAARGYDAKVYIVGNKEHMTPDMKNQITIARNTGVDFKDTVDFSDYDTIIDAVFGIGLSRDVTGEYADIIDKINESNCQIISIDIPSGINSDTGKVMGCAVQADKTVTFGFNKLGLVLYPGCIFAGDITVADIGFSEEAIDTLQDQPVMMLENETIDLIDILRSPSGNKGTFGKVLIIAGSVNMCGAAVFCAKAAYRSGCGLVKVITPSDNRIIIQTLVPEALLETYDAGIPEDVLREALEWADSVAIGPGIGINSISKDIVKTVLKEYKGKLVIDADGLTCIKNDIDLLKAYKGKLIITPHVGEMSRLTGKAINDIKDDLIGTCKLFAEENSLTCVLKDARTVICDSEGNIYLNSTGDSGMATGGSGDVLTGMIAGIIAQDTLGEISVPLAVMLHGIAGEKASKLKGKHAVTASDIIDNI